MKRKVVQRAAVPALSAALMVTSLTGCTFGFASDPDDPNEVEEKVPIDLSTDTFTYDSSLSGTNITLLNSKAEIQTALEEMADIFEEKSGVHIEVMPISDDSPYTKVVSLYNSGTPPTLSNAANTFYFGYHGRNSISRRKSGGFVRRDVDEGSRKLSHEDKWQRIQSPTLY